MMHTQTMHYGCNYGENVLKFPVYCTFQRLAKPVGRNFTV